MINTSNSKLHNNVTRTMRNSAMLLLICRLLMDAVIFCAFEKTQEPMWAGWWEKGWYVGGRSLYKKNSTCRL